MLDRYPSSPPGSRQIDDDHEHAPTALGPWHEATESPLEPRPPPRNRSEPSKPSKSPSGRSTRPKIVVHTSKKAATTALSPRSTLSSGRPALPRLDLGGVCSSQPQSLSARTLDASPVSEAYRALVEQTGAMELALTRRSEARREAATALRAGVDNLSQPLVEAQKKLLRLEALRNEVDIFHQHLDPFVFGINSAHEHEVRSSVYRHFSRMRAVQDMGVPIYGIGEYALEPTDRVLVPRATHRVYRRIRRRDAMHFIDADLIPRAGIARKGRQQQTTEVEQCEQ